MLSRTPFRHLKSKKETEAKDSGFDSSLCLGDNYCQLGCRQLRVMKKWYFPHLRLQTETYPPPFWQHGLAHRGCWCVSLVSKCREGGREAGECLPSLLFPGVCLQKGREEPGPETQAGREPQLAGPRVRSLKP